MKLTILLFIMAFLISCATKTEKKLTIEQEVSDYEVKSFAEVKTHAQHLLERHPEISEEAKAKLAPLIDQTMNRLQDLKNEESKLVQSLLNTTIENKNKNETPKELKKRLRMVYKAKYENIKKLVEEINDMYLKKLLDERFTRDAHIFMRDFR